MVPSKIVKKLYGQPTFSILWLADVVVSSMIISDVMCCRILARSNSEQLTVRHFCILYPL